MFYSQVNCNNQDIVSNYVISFSSYAKEEIILVIFLSKYFYNANILKIVFFSLVLFIWIIQVEFYYRCQDVRSQFSKKGKHLFHSLQMH